jgi:hypothetical protein
MSYDVHITSAEEWSENETAPITLEEWVACAKSDPELRVDVIDGRTESPLPDGRVVSFKVKGLVAWLGQADPHTRKVLAWFAWYSGNIDTRAPDRATLRKMYEIAEALQARVQGDEGEIYDAAGEPYAEP